MALLDAAFFFLIRELMKPFNAEILPGSSPKAGRRSVSVGIPFCCSWCEYHVHAYSNA